MDDLPDLTDRDTWTDDDLDQLRIAVLTEQERRYLLDTAEQRVVDVSSAYIRARDGAQPDPAAATADDYPLYVTPAGGHAAYTSGYIIRDDQGQLHRANRSGVVHSPIEAPEDWTRVWLIDGALSDTPPVDPDTGQPDWPAWDSTVTYRRSADQVVKVTHEGHLWNLVHDNAVAGWEPGGVGMHGVWKDEGPIA